MQRLFRNVIVMAAVLIASSVALGAQKPNILFLFADDYAFDAAGHMGNAEVKTPNLDRLAASGTVFTHSYNPGGYQPAVCVASRTMLTTGRFMWNALELKAEQERQAGRFWPQLMKQAGYRTYMTGKWHIDADAKQAFDVARDIRPGMPRTVKEAYNRRIEGQPDAWSPYDTSIGGYWAGGKHWSEVVADHTEAYLAEAAGRKGEPFFMYVAFNAPHDPRQSPKEFVDMYPPERVSTPANFLPAYPYAEPMGAPHSLRDENLAPMPRTEYAVKVHRGEYYALITHLDVQIGRVLDALEKSGMKDNTIIIFTADHGLACGHHGLMGKQNMYEHSLRVPFIVAGAGVEAGKRIDTPIYLQDAMPTSLELAGAKVPDFVDFKSVAPLLRGSPRHYDVIYGAYTDRQRALVDGEYKLIVYPQAKVARLFHLPSDEHEMKDLAGEAQHATRVREMLAKLRKVQGDVKDKLELGL
jgi:choline-sulfatase